MLLYIAEILFLPSDTLLYMLGRWNCQNRPSNCQIHRQHHSYQHPMSPLLFVITCSARENNLDFFERSIRYIAHNEWEILHCCDLLVVITAVLSDTSPCLASVFCACTEYDCLDLAPVFSLLCNIGTGVLWKHVDVAADFTTFYSLRKKR